MKSALIKLHIAVLLAGFTAILGKLISLGEGPLVWWRLVITVVVLWSGLFLVKKITIVPFKIKITLLIIGIFIGLHWLCFFGSVKYANVSIALVCLSCGGFFSALMEPIIRRSKFRPADLLLGLISIAGIYIIFHFDTKFKTGIILGVLAAMLSALFSIFNKKLVTQVDGLSITAYEMLGALFTLSCLMPFYLKYVAAAFMPIGWDWLWLSILAIFCTVWAFILQLQSLKYISAFTLNLSYNLEPIYGIILAFIFFKENQQLSSQFYIGLLLIIFSIVLQMFRIWKERSTAKRLQF